MHQQSGIEYLMLLTRFNFLIELWRVLIMAIYSPEHFIEWLIVFIKNQGNTVCS